MPTRDEVQRLVLVCSAFSIFTVGCAHAPEPGETDEGMLRTYRPVRASGPVANRAPTVAEPVTSSPMTASQMRDPEPEPEPARVVAAPNENRARVEAEAETRYDEPQTVDATESTHQYEPDPSEMSPALFTVNVKGKKKCLVSVEGRKIGRSPIRKHELQPGLQRVVVQCKNKQAAVRLIDFTAGRHEKLVLKAKLLKPKGKKRRGRFAKR